MSLATVQESLRGQPSGATGQRADTSAASRTRDARLRNRSHARHKLGGVSSWVRMAERRVHGASGMKTLASKQAAECIAICASKQRASNCNVSIRNASIATASSANF